MSSNANLIKCAGLRTFGNELSIEEGSLRQATNVNIDEEGVITPRRGFNDYGGPTTGSETTAAITKQLMVYKERIIRFFQTSLEYENSNSTFSSITGTFNEVSEGVRLKYQEANSNLYFTTSEGIKKISVRSNSNFSSTMVTNAGGLKGSYIYGTVLPDVGGFLPPQSKVAYRVTFGTKDANNMVIEGSPSARFVITNYNNSQVTKEQSSIEIENSASINDGDYILYQNSSGKYVIFFDTTGSYTVEPKTAQTIGATYIKVTIQGLSDAATAATIANVISNEIQDIEVSIDTLVPEKVIITSTEEIDIVGLGTTPTAKDKDGVALGAGIIALSTDTAGNVVEGSFCNVQLEGVIPQGATTDYYYRIYRSAYIELPVGLELTDIDPGDEHYLVYESPITQDNINDGSFEFTDTTPDSFRASSLPLYTNEGTGEGILQANDIPPVALDIELFRNSMFYANTRGRHTLETNMLSIDDFVSGSTRFVVGNSSITRYYTFVGTSQVQDIVVDAVPTAGDYINIFSANNERQYYIYFGDSVNNPNIAGAIGYRIGLDGSPDETEIATRIVNALIDNVDFDITSLVDTVTFSWTNNGYTDGITSGVGTDITINLPSVSGSGELSGTDEGGDVLLSGLDSVGQSVDETARSLVKIISQDQDSPINAYYLSNSDSLPGNILFEARSLSDDSFFIAIEEPSFAEIGQEFNPNLPASESIEEFTGTGLTTVITLTNHGFSNGDNVFVGYFKDPLNPTDPTSFSGNYAITVLTVNTFSIPVNTSNTVISFVPDFSCIFYPDQESDNDVAPNRIYYSKVRQPEAVPLINFIDVGSKDKQIERILALRDNLFVLKEDGVYVVSGSSAPDFSVRLLDNTRIIAPDSAVVLNNQIYCLTEQGISIITDAGVGVISRGIENLIDNVTIANQDFWKHTFGVAYENDRAFIMFCPAKPTDMSATQAYRYNIFERTWSKWEYNATCAVVKEREAKLYVGNGDRNYVSQERKNNDRTDHSDRNFTREIGSEAVSSDLIRISSLVDVEVNDVIVQTQDVTIYYINNRILRKMDLFDSGLTAPISSTFLDTFKVSVGDSIHGAMQEINDYLVTLDPANITVKAFTSNNVRNMTELLIDELNDVATITAIKTYKKPETVVYEAYIKEVDKLRNIITVHIPRPFIQGNISVYKGFDQIIEWNPQHFGDPSSLKQIRYITVMFDQNNFYDATVKFASDAVQATKQVEFIQKGIGYWGDMPWGNPNHYWGGVGNDIPFRNPVPRNMQKCRYLSLTFEHYNAREYFRIVGISATIRPISDRAYK